MPIRWKGMRESRHYRVTDLPRAVPAEGPKKPPLRAPCNGCGVCCIAEPCMIAVTLIPGVRMDRPCPALEWEHGRSWCGMVRRPHYYSELARLGPENEREVSEAIQVDLGGMGSGCDSDPAEDPGALDGMTAAEFLGQQWQSR